MNNTQLWRKRENQRNDDTTRSFVLCKFSLRELLCSMDYDIPLFNPNASSPGLPPYSSRINLFSGFMDVILVMDEGTI